MIYQYDQADNRRMEKVKSGGNKLLADLIKEAIADSGLAAKEIAALCGVSPQAVTGWKQNGRIGKETLALLAAATNKPPSYFSTIDIPGMPTESQQSGELDDVIKLITLFKESTDRGRRAILSMAEDAPKLPATGRKVASN